MKGASWYCWIASLLVWWTIATPVLRGEGRPNVLIILADDCTYNDLPMYGGQAKTPHLQQLAAAGLVFERAYLASAMCQPCRAELYSGQYPLRNGCAWNHSASRPDLKSMPHYLTAAGYRAGLAGKVHVLPANAFPFEHVPGFDANCVRQPTHAHDLNGVRDFLTRDSEQPFCLVVALVEPHVPWVMGDPSQYPPDQLVLPPTLADTPRTRVDYGRYLAEITYMDQQVGELLATLRAAGLDDDTLVLFSSEQGSQFPGNKWTNWDTGVHTALIARWPSRVPQGKRTPALVQYADILPTLLELSGGHAANEHLDGTSFLAVLEGKQDHHRRFVYGCHNNLPEGPAYPIRSITDGIFHYLRNLSSEELFIEKHLMGADGNGELNNPYWGTWIFATQSQPKTYELVKRYLRRPPEQLYHTAEDPYELVDLAGQPQHAAVQQRLAHELDRWLRSQGDPGRLMDTLPILQAARKGRHAFRPAAEIPATP